MERAEPRKIGRLPVLGAQAHTPRSTERSLRLSLDETLGESPLMTGLHDMDLPPPVLPRSPLAHHAELDDDDDIEDTDFVPNENEGQDASSSDMDEEPVWDEPSPPRPLPARTPAREAPARRTPQSQRAPPPSTTPGPAEPAGYYDTIDFDKITDPFTDTRRAFMRGKAQAPPPPRPDTVSPAPMAGPSRLPPPRASPAKAPTPMRTSPVKARTPISASPAKAPTPLRASPVKARTPISVRPAPLERSRASLAPGQASPAPASPWSAQRAHHSPAVPGRGTPRKAPAPPAAVPATKAETATVRTRPSTAEAPPSPRRSVPTPRGPSSPARAAPRAVQPAAPSPSRAVQPVVPSPSRAVPAAPPTRSNRLLTEELLKWKRRCAELEEELDTMHDRLVHARGDACGWTSEQAALQEQVTALQRGRESDRRAMRQRVRVLESHMADTKIEYDNRYWRLLTSSSDGADELDSVHVQLVVHQNEVTKLQSELAEQRRRLRLAHEQTAFLAGLYAHRGHQQATAQADDTQRLRQQVAELQQQVAAEAAARQVAEAELAAQHASRRSSVVEAAPPTEFAPSLEAYGVRAEPGLWTEDAQASPTEQRATPTHEDEPPAATPARAPALRPGMTPMLERTAMAAPDLDAEATPMLGTRVRDDPEPQARKKKRRLIGSGQGFLRLADGAESLSPTLDVPADLPPLA
ncbi:hypothetical protein MCAP1_001425 [Malassezia caprae]|uniref:Uncharacterized protein n=1 Tax=Malassezia caprae TaxID=1381934 RepID=A0AAF0EAQ4_9BASI|nr:hypothetical protein MCAP1_001425 [Malassezia caprae]